MSPRRGALLLLVAGAACGGGDSPEGTAAAESAEAPTTAHASPLPAVEAETVLGWTGPGGAAFEVAVPTPGRLGHERRFGRRTFEVALRGGARTHDQCASCHLPGRAPAAGPRAADAHQDVRPVHPSESGDACATCHAPDDPERLRLEGGERVALGHAYRLCGQCHFAQAEAWAAGAHGKRLDTWAGRRVVMGCADCHDPHDPGLRPRIPFAGPRIPRTGGGDP